MSTGIILLAHGSRDPRAQRTVHALAALVADRLAATPVRVAFLELAEPDLRTAIRELAGTGVERIRVVPLLFAPGVHVRHDVPAAVAATAQELPGTLVELAPPLVDPVRDPAGADLLLAGLERRMRTGVRAALGPSGLVLVAAGSSDAAARNVVHRLADRWGLRRGLPAAAAFATGPGERPEEAIRRVSAAAGDARRIALGSLFVADGTLPARAADSAARAGVTSPPVLGVVTELVELVVRRAAARPLATSSAGHTR